MTSGPERPEGPGEFDGERVAVWIQLHPGEACSVEEIRESCREHLAHFKVPSDVRFVEAFPMTVTGKLQKFRMREQMPAEAESGQA